MKFNNLQMKFFSQALLLSSAFCSAYVLSNESATLTIGSPGVVAYNEGRYQEATEYFVKQLQDYELKNESLMYLSRIALETGDVQTAADNIEEALALTPTDADEIVLSGDIYCNQAQQSSIFTALGLAKKCIAQYEAAIKHSPDDADALLSAIRFYLEAPGVAGGSTKKGKELLEHLRVVSPEHANTYRVFLLDNEGKSEAALQLADELSKKEFQSAKSQYELARFYRDKTLFAKARPLFESLLTKPITAQNKWYINDSLLQVGEILLAENRDITRSIALLTEYKTKNTNSHDQHYFWSTWSLALAYKANGNQDKYEQLVKKIQSEDYEKNADFAKRFEAGIKEN